jgi:O-6-methylguanine DNA methyltransferase
LLIALIELCTKNINDIWFGVAYQKQNILSTAFSASQKTTLSSLLNSIPYNAAFQVVPNGSVFAMKIISLMKNIYDGKESSQFFNLSYDHLRVYTGQVLMVVSQIPVGYVSSYGFIAKAVGGGPRAIGNVMASNPFAPIVPCHRVVTSDLRLGGYSGGLALKFDLLKRERRGYTKQRKILVDGKQLQVFPVEFVFSQLEKKCPSLFSINPFAKNQD